MFDKTKDEGKKPDLKLSDFAFLNAGKLRKMEIRYNSNTSENKLYGRAAFIIDHKRDDTQVEVFVTGKDYPEVMRKLHDWHENYFVNIKVFGKLSGREKEQKEDNTGVGIGAHM